MPKINRISPLDHKFLQTLADIAKKPDKLYYMGELPAERRPSVAIVGSRKPTSYGREVTERIAGELARRGVVVISGLALGIDAIAHRAALEAGGTTIAVLANPLPDIRPATNRQLGKDILEHGGAIISEHDEGYMVGGWSFLERNRLISGLADIVIVTEAAARSGSLNTAAHALEQGKDVYALPGNITNPLSAGCNHLIRLGATPLLSSQDVLDKLMPSAGKAENLPLPLGQNEVENSIITALSEGIRDGEELFSRAKCDASEFSNAITMLEINGIISALGNNQWRLE